MEAAKASVVGGGGEGVGGIAEWLIASDLSAALQDFKIGFPGMLLQVVLGWVILKGMAKYEC